MAIRTLLLGLLTVILLTACGRGNGDSSARQPGERLNGGVTVLHGDFPKNLTLPPGGDDGIPDNEDRRFVYGWIATRTASDPSLLHTAPEKKLFSALGYHLNANIGAYNDAIGGPPAIKLHQLHSDFSNALVFSEPGMQALDGNLYVSLVSRTATEGTVILIKRDHSSGSWAMSRDY
jgi:hypothetical protein